MRFEPGGAVGRGGGLAGGQAPPAPPAVACRGHAAPQRTTVRLARRERPRRDDEVREILAAGQDFSELSRAVAEAIAVARFHMAEAAYTWDALRSQPLPHDDEPFAT